MEGIIRKLCAYGLELKGSDGFTHYWCTIVPALELEYRKSINSSTHKKPEMLEEGWNSIIPYYTLKKDMFDINPTESSFKIMLEK
ncbi:hypothetical protein O181_098356 [Austropuccinia psidii MF-1]|uniref:Uncharacterized protein n=1 Tax=Austropuccinia psidii MF-1 TaxID=1389203 RepID=A0A9Q3JAR0_9BASI|nr:hypothetical protein [Austropuccinia psidii MF-1]